MQDADHIAGPTHRHGARRHGVFQHQRPADHPGEQLAHDRIGVGVGRARHWHHGGEFRIAKRGDGADRSGDDEGYHHARPGLLRGLGGEDENARADNGADAEHGELKSAKRTRQRVLPGGRENRIERFHPIE